MKVLMLSIDEKIFERGSPASQRMIEYGSLVQELHIVVYTRLGRTRTLLAPNVTLYPTNTRSKMMYFWVAYRLCKKLLLGDSGMLVTSQDAFTSIVALQLRSRFPGMKFEVQVHTDITSRYFPRESLKNRLRYIVYRLSFRRANCIRVVSQRVKDGLVSGFGVPAEKISVLPIFVDVGTISGAASPAREQAKYPEFGARILMVSRFTREKNMPLALSAFKEVLSRRKDAGLIILGNGPEALKLQKLARRMNLEQSVRWEGWQSNPHSYYKTADLLLITSNYEGYGAVIVEALAAGLPVISTDVGTARESGAIIAARSPGAIAGKIIEVLARRERGSLRNYPYASRADYLKRCRAQWERCGANLLPVAVL